MSVWIRCTERMPRKGRPVRIYTHTLGFRTAIHFPNADAFISDDEQSPSIPVKDVVSWREVSEKEGDLFQAKFAKVLF